MLNFGASKPRVKGGLGPQGPPGSTPVKELDKATTIEIKATKVCCGCNHRRYNKQMQQLLYEPMCQLFCSAPSGSETQLQICY